MHLVEKQELDAYKGYRHICIWFLDWSPSKVNEAVKTFSKFTGCYYSMQQNHNETTIQHKTAEDKIKSN